MDIFWLKVILVVISCVVIFLLNNLYFKKTIPLDPRGEYGAAGQMASLNGVITLYMIIAAASILLAHFMNPLAQYVGSVILSVILVVELISFLRSNSASKKAFRKMEADKIPVHVIEQARAISHVMLSSRISADVFLAFLTLLTWL